MNESRETALLTITMNVWQFVSYRAAIFSLSYLELFYIVVYFRKYPHIVEHIQLLVKVYVFGKKTILNVEEFYNCIVGRKCVLQWLFGRSLNLRSSKIIATVWIWSFKYFPYTHSLLDLLWGFVSKLISVVSIKSSFAFIWNQPKSLE